MALAAIVGLIAAPGLNSWAFNISFNAVPRQSRQKTILSAKICIIGCILAPPPPPANENGFGLALRLSQFKSNA